jgi:2-polyprenyl-3-methyl-5-hydroxy-6-metoxy-1,4-benzoquinol methylase
MNDQQRLLTDYFRLMNMNGAARVYRYGVQSGLCDALSGGPMTAGEVATKCGTFLQPTMLVLEALGSLGIARREGDRYSLTFLAQMLLGGSYRELGDKYWDHLPALMKTGHPIVRMDSAAESESHYQTQAAALAWMLGPAAELAAEMLLVDDDLADKSILDLGAGSGIWSLTLARHAPTARITAIDWPAVLEVAADYARQFEVEDRFTSIAGNYHEVELPAEAFDLAIFGNVTHLESPEGNLSLFQKVRRSLKPGGRVVIFDAFPGDSQGDVNRTLYALGLALRTEHGHIYTSAELQSLLTQAGFGQAALTNLPTPPYAVGMLVACTNESE